MKKKATPRSAKASSRQPSLSFQISSEASVVAESAAAETSKKSGAKKRRKLTADFADDTDKNTNSHCDSSAISAQSAVKNSTLAPTDSWSNCEGTKEDCRWPVIPLGELAADGRNSITDGPFGSKLKTGHYTDTGPRVIRLKNIGDTEFVDAKAHISEAHFATLQKHRDFPGDVVIAALGEDPPRSCLVPEHLGPAIVKADCIRFKAGPRILPKFINYVLNAPDLRRYAKAIVHGVGRPRLNLREIKSLPIPVPPLPEQRRIVAEIEKHFTRLDAGVSALKRVQANLKRYRAAVLKAACEGRLVRTEAALRRTADNADVADKEVRPSVSSAKSAVKTPAFETGEQLLARILIERRQNWQGRGKYKEPGVPDTAKLDPLTEGWTWASVAQLGDVPLGRQRSPKNVSKNFPTKYIRAANITERGIDVSDVLEMEFSPAERERFSLRDGDIVLSEASGSPSQVGKPAVWRGDRVLQPRCHHLGRLPGEIAAGHAGSHLGHAAAAGIHREGLHDGR